MVSTVSMVSAGLMDAADGQHKPPLARGQQVRLDASGAQKGSLYLSVYFYLQATD